MTNDPASGRPTVLITRAAIPARKMAEGLTRDGWSVIISPVLVHEPLGPTPDVSDAPDFALTSAVAADALPANAARVFAVGPSTAAAAKARGAREIITGPGDAAGLTEMILARAAGPRILHLCGEDTAFPIADALRAAGRPADAAAVYRMAPARALSDESLVALAAGAVTALPLYSHRSGEIFASLLTDAARDGLAATHLLAISPDVAQSVREVPFKMRRVAAAPTGDAMRNGLRALAARLSDAR